MKKTILLLITLTYLLLISCNNNSDFIRARDTIVIPDMQRYVSSLGSDSFMGRAPFTIGEEITVAYLAQELAMIGFEPAFGESYFQEVPMVKIRSSVLNPVRITGKGNEFEFGTPGQLAIISPQTTDVVNVENSPVVFAGFGIVAPEYGWNDYEGIDVRGKTVIVLINDPGLYTGDTTLFKGKEMTYYGRWTYKYEEAARQGAAGILIVHETLGAGYSYTVPRNSSVNPNLFLRSDGCDSTLCLFTGWISAGPADEIFSSLGLNVGELRKEACKKGFRGSPLDLRISLKINNKIEYNNSRNVAGILRGSERPDESIVYTAHWDHFGIGETENGDSIFNGAVDNGTSMAWELSIGKAFAALKKRPARSIVLLFPTAEEQGLAGSLFYTKNPPLPIEKTVACLNNDLLLPMGRMKDVMITGYGQSELDEYVKRAAGEQDRYITGDPDSHTGMYFRSDHFSFAKKGVPSLFVRGNTDSREFGKEWAAATVKDYIDNKYHRTSDNYEPEKWNFEGIREDAQLAFTIGYQLATSNAFPKWNSYSEFSLLRE